MLEFINSHQKLQNGDNWFDPFSTSVDLKEALKQRLKKPIEKARISSLLQHAKLPTFKLSSGERRDNGLYIAFSGATPNETIYNVSCHSSNRDSGVVDVFGLENHKHFIETSDTQSFS